jgi:hypothetical protein
MHRKMPVRFGKGRISLGIRLFHRPHERHHCLRLTVGTINPRIGLSPTSKRPCWAHYKTTPAITARVGALVLSNW